MKHLFSFFALSCLFLCPLVFRSYLSCWHATVMILKNCLYFYVLFFFTLKMILVLKNVHCPSVDYIRKYFLRLTVLLLLLLTPNECIFLLPFLNVQSSFQVFL